MEAKEIYDAYAAVAAKANAASNHYRAVGKAYRAGLVGDDEFLAARAEYDKIQAEFDVAYAAASEINQQAS